MDNGKICTFHKKIYIENKWYEVDTDILYGLLYNDLEYMFDSNFCYDDYKSHEVKGNFLYVRMKNNDLSKYYIPVCCSDRKLVKIKFKEIDDEDNS